MEAAYWDLNGTIGGAGADEFGAAEGTWDASTTFWNDTADGTGSTAAGTAFRLAIFAAGSDATGTYTVHVDGTQEIAGLRFEEGNVTLQQAEEPGTPGTLRLVWDSMVTVAPELTATVETPIIEDVAGRVLIKDGDGTLILAPGVIGYTGGTKVVAGTLKTSGAGVFDGSAVTVAGNAAGVTATLDLGIYSDTIGSLTLGGMTTSSGAAVTTTGAGMLTLGGNVIYDNANNPAGATISGKLDLGGDNRTFTVIDSATAADDLTVSADISGTGVGLTKDGAGKLLLSGTNTYGGPTTLAAGILEVTSAAALPGYASAGNVVFDGGTLLFVNGGALTTGDVDTIMANATKTSGVLAIDTSSGNLTQWAAFNFGGVGVTKLGGNTLVLDQANTYSDTLVSGGILNANATDSLGTGSVTVTGGALNINAAQSFTGETVVSGGTLQLSNADAIASSTGLSLAGGSVTLTTDLNLKALTFSGSVSQTISGQALNFGPGGSITVSYRNAKHTITSAITGDPNVLVADGTSYDGIKFAPTTGTVALGVCTIPYENGTGDKAGIILDGTTIDNTVKSVINTGGHYGRVTKRGTGTWTVNGDIYNIGTLWLEGGTLVLNGQYFSKYAGMKAIPNGARLSGDFSYLKQDPRSGYFVVQSGGIVAPGDNGIWRATLEWTEERADEAYAHFQDGSIYEWEIGADDANGNPTTDTIHIARVDRARSLDLDNFILKIFDAGGSVGIGAELPVFTYDTGVTIDMDGFGNAADNFDTDELGAGWNIGDLSLTDGGSGIIYLTGLSNSLPGDTNGDGIVDAADYIVLKRNIGMASGAELTDGDVDKDGDVDWDDLQLLQANFGEGSAAADTIPEPATLIILAAGLPALLKRRRSRS